MVETAAYYYDGRISGKQDVNLQICEEKLCIVNPLTTDNTLKDKNNSIFDFPDYLSTHPSNQKRIDFFLSSSQSNNQNLQNCLTMKKETGCALKVL
ncbi:hypothetical protein MHK_001256 [Candidatus Magnetomorum sp. HK-1]|nr:hypothetical protein MHK_001256 [Candidatus Magnetomorum sp. HK-1]